MTAGEPAVRGSGWSICLLANSLLDRLAYRLLLRLELACEVAAESDFAPASVWAALRSKPHLVLLDADTALTQAVEAAQMISRLQPSTRILVMGTAVDPLVLHPWSRCRIHGYVVKGGGLEELRMALKAVVDHRQYFSEGVRHAIRPSGGNRRRVQLSPREQELLPLLARGLTLREAALKMTVSYKTADSYRTNLLRKLGLHDRVELARYAIRERIIDP